MNVVARKKKQQQQPNRLRREVWRLAAPAVVEQVLVMSVGIVDTALVGRVGPDAFASVDVSNRFMMFALAVFGAIQVGTTAIVARHIGAGERKEANEAAKQALLMVLSVAFPLAALGILLAPKLIGFMMIMNKAPDPRVVTQAIQYMRIVFASMPLAMIMMTVNAVLRGAGDTRTPMAVTGLTNVINVIGNSLFIFGLGPFPRMGVAGAALGTAIAQISGGLLVLAVLYSDRSVLHLTLRESYRFDSQILKRILNVGIPSAVEQFLMRGGQLVFSMIIASMGTVAMAAHAITLNAESLSFMPGSGFGIAATTLIGQYLGAKDPEMAERSSYESAKMGVAVMGVMGLIFFLMPSPLIRLFTNDPEEIALGTKCLRLVAISQPFLAMLMILSGALRGAGDTRWVMIATVLALWPLRVGLAYVLGVYLGWGLVGAWTAMVVDLIARASLMTFRFRSGRWKTIRV